MTTIARKTIPALVTALWLATSACVVTSLSPREAFLRAHPTERAKYVKLWEVSPESLRQAAEERHSQSESLMRSLQKDFGKYPDLNERLEAIQARLKKFIGFENDDLEKVVRKAAFDPKKDTLFFYEQRDGLHDEFGWLVVRANRIRLKHVLGAGEWPSPK